MHEMALAKAWSALVEDEARKQGFSASNPCAWKSACSAGVAPEAMLFCFDAVRHGTIAEGAKLVIERTPGAGWCLDCGKTVALAERFGACPECGSTTCR